MCVCVWWGWMQACTCHGGLVRSEDSSVESVLHLSVSSRDRTQVLLVLPPCLYMLVCVQGPEEAWRSQIPGAGVVGGYEPADAGAGKWTQVLCKRGLCWTTFPASQSSVPCCACPTVLQLTIACLVRDDCALWEDVCRSGLSCARYDFSETMSHVREEKPRESLQRHPWAVDLCSRSSLLKTHFCVASYPIPGRVLGISHCHCWLGTVFCIGHRISMTWKSKWILFI